MINGAHIILYSTDAEADRVFIRDVLGFAGVDAGDGWLMTDDSSPTAKRRPLSRSR